MSTILMYHYLGDVPASSAGHESLFVPPREFRSQLRFLASHRYRTVSPEEYSAGLAVGALHHIAWLTFDDGRVDNHSEALPALVAARLRATFFIIANRSLSGEKGFMDRAMLRELIAAKMSIGSHSLTHPHLARIPPAKMRAEVADSKKKLEDALGVEIASFCYPYGNFNAAVVDAVREAGYQLAVSTIRDNRNTEADRWRLRRVMVQPGRTGLRFRYLFSSAYHWIHAAKNKRSWRRKSGE